ncbi:hypothetical protein JXB41_00585 [Candidatus Woesearchaeota archaeon]|nr:hypothetical protein [Candidatus Woesearchaeota archaeon]
MKRLFLTVLSIFLILISFANSEIIVSEYQPILDFQVSYTKIIDICETGFASTKLIIKNTGNIETQFKVVSDSKYSSIYPNTFFLKPQETKQIIHIINLPSGVSHNFDIVFSVITSNNLKKEFTQGINIEKCPNLAVRAVNTSASITPCTKADFIIKLFNPGQYYEKYYFSLKDFKGKANLPLNIYLKQNSSELVRFSLEPDCDVYGQTNPVMVIETGTSKLQAEIPLSLNIERDYNFSISLQEQTEACNKIETRIPVTITNHVNLTNKYSLQIKNDFSWVDFDQNDIILEPYEEKIINLIFNPELKQESSYLIPIIAESEYGDLTVEKQINVNVINCYDYDFYFENNKICVDDNELNLVLQNKGKFNTEFIVDLTTSADFISLTKQNITLSPEQSMEIPVKIDGSLTGKYALKANSVVKDKPFSKEASVNLDVISLYDCYKPEIVTNSLWVKHGEQEQKLQIQNTGLKEARYELTQDDFDWLEIEDVRVTLEKEERQEIPLAANIGNQTKQGIYPILFKIQERDNEQQYEKKIYFIVFDYTFKEFVWKFKCFISLGFISFIILILIIVLLFKLRYDKNIISCLIWILILIIIALIIVNTCFPFFRDFFNLFYKNNIDITENECLTYFDESVCSSRLYHSWKEDHIYTINLNDYFEDPDGDLLNFSASGTGNITISIIAQTAKLFPAKEWYGIETVSFIADDRKGGITVSPLFYLHVLNVKEFSLNDFILDYYTQIIIVLCIILALAIFLLNKTYKKKPKKNKKKKKK